MIVEGGPGGWVRALVVVWIVIHVAPAVAAPPALFPGVSKYHFFSRVALKLRHPMMDEGWLLDPEVDWRDHSVFSDAFYADGLPIARLSNQYASMLTVGATVGRPDLYAYAIVAGLGAYQPTRAVWGKGIVGGGIRHPIWQWLVLDAYLQVEGDTDDGFDWQVGITPLQSRWLSAALRAQLHLEQLDIFESETLIPFVRLSWLRSFARDTDRYAIATSYREFRRMLAADAERPDNDWDLEVQAALSRSRAPEENVWEARVMAWVSTVGEGAAGEARPGVHFNVSYVSENSTPFEGLGAELGFGAKQVDTRESQQVYFTVFYHYADYFYRYPSVLWGLGLVARV